MNTTAVRLTLALSVGLSLVVSVARPVGSSPSLVSLDVPERADSTPWVAASGSFVAVAWGATVAGKTDVYLAVSRDGGSTFGPPVQVNRTPGEARLGGELPPRVAVVRRPRTEPPEIVVLWTARTPATEIKVARSRDGGKSFDGPTTLQSSGAAGDRGWPAVALDERAAIHALWLDHRGLADRPKGGGDAGHRHRGEHDPSAMAQKSALYYAAFGAMASPERPLTHGVCYCCKTALAAGPNGRLYAAWRHVYPGNLRDIAFAASRDGGRTFSAPSRVSEDGWAINGCPDDGPAIAVGERGEVHVVWPTVVEEAGGPEGAIFYASTRDGERFAPRLRVPTLGGPKPSHPQIAVAPGGRLFVAWDENINGQRVAAVREMQVRSQGEPWFGEITTLSPSGPAMYPVLASTDDGLVAVWTTAGEQSRVMAGRTTFAETATRRSR